MIYQTNLKEFSVSVSKNWHTETDPGVLLYQVALLTGRDGWPSREDVALVACEIARSTEDHLRDDDDMAQMTLSQTEMWCRTDPEEITIRNRLLLSAARNADALKKRIEKTKPESREYNAIAAILYAAKTATSGPLRLRARHAFSVPGYAIKASLIDTSRMLAAENRLCDFIRGALDIPDGERQ